MTESLLAQTTVQVALMPGFLDPVNLLNSFGTWVLAGLLLVVFIESGLLFPLLPGDSLLFTAGLIVAAKSTEVEPFAPLWVLLVTIPIAAFLGDQVGYFIGNRLGYTLFKPNNKVLKEAYIVEAHQFFEKHGPITIVLARFVPIVRTYAPLVAGAARMRYSVFVTYNIVGAVLWGCGVTLLGYFLGQIQFIADNVDLIFILIVLLSVIPILTEIFKRWRNRSAEIDETPVDLDDSSTSAAELDPSDLDSADSDPKKDS
ncbi:DedA family protein [Gordonia caeni]|uniref:VTT domain-containing protein n=1 Tax=Gordonia caeni TaxID=1007097 RepID=A0ABP7NVS6_9ACTN